MAEENAVQEVQEVPQDAVAAESAPTTIAEIESDVLEGEALEKLLKKKARTKVNGKDEMIDMAAAFKALQKEKASDEKFRNASQMIKEAEDFLNDPWGYAHKKGKDPYKIAEDLLLEKLKFEQMSPTEKALAESERKRVEYENKLKTFEDEKKTHELKQAEQRYVQEIDAEISSVLRDRNEKPTPFLIKEIASHMLAHLESGGGMLSAKEALQMYDQHSEGLLAERLQKMSPESLSKILPKKILDGLRKADVDRVLAQDPYSSRNKTETEAITPKPKRLQSTDDFFSKLEKKWS